MFKITVEKECSCFKDSKLTNNITITSKDDALIKSLEMKNYMNQEFCGKHEFKVKEAGNNFVIAFDELSNGSCGCGSCGCGSH